MSGYQDQNADERTRDNDERYQDTHDRDADRADESRGNFFADSIFELAKSTNDTYRAAYEAGRLAGFQEGAKAAADLALKAIRRPT